MIPTKVIQKKSWRDKVSWNFKIDKEWIMVSCFRKIKISLQKKIFIRYSLRRISYLEHGKNSAEKSSKSAKMCKLYESAFLRTRQTNYRENVQNRDSSRKCKSKSQWDIVSPLLSWGGYYHKVGTEELAISAKHLLQKHEGLSWDS